MTRASERRAGQPSARSVARRTCIAAAPRMIISRLVRILQRWARRRHGLARAIADRRPGGLFATPGLHARAACNARAARRTSQQATRRDDGTRGSVRSEHARHQPVGTTQPLPTREARSSKRPNSSGSIRTIVRTLLRLLPHRAEEAPLESGEEAVHGGLQTARAGSEQRLSEQRLSKAMTH